MEPNDALRSIEIALRLVVRDVLGSDWQDAKGAPNKDELDKRRQEEAKRRDGTVVSDDLLDYTETYHLTDIVEKNWESFKPVFDDKARTVAFFGVLKDVRNSIAHSRDLVPFERDLISGIAGQLRSQVALFRSMNNSSSRYYPLIEDVVDNFGHRGMKSGEAGSYSPTLRLEVGDTLTFSGKAFNAKGKPVRWYIITGSVFPASTRKKEVAVGDSVTFNYTISEDDVSESRLLVIRIESDSKYHLRAISNLTLDSAEPYDDERGFWYSVNPPDGE